MTDNISCIGGRTFKHTYRRKHNYMVYWCCRHILCLHESLKHGSSQVFIMGWHNYLMLLCGTLYHTLLPIIRWAIICRKAFPEYITKHMLNMWEICPIYKLRWLRWTSTCEKRMWQTVIQTDHSTWTIVIQTDHSIVALH